jgi:hypothetical protein
MTLGLELLNRGSKVFEHHFYIIITWTAAQKFKLDERQNFLRREGISSGQLILDGRTRLNGPGARPHSLSLVAF